MRRELRQHEQAIETQSDGPWSWGGTAEELKGGRAEKSNEGSGSAGEGGDIGDCVVVVLMLMKGVTIGRVVGSGDLESCCRGKRKEQARVRRLDIRTNPVVV